MENLCAEAGVRKALLALAIRSLVWNMWCIEAMEVLRPISDSKGSKIGRTGAAMVRVWAERVRRVGWRTL
jgi:hypothetical protein